MGAAGDVRLRRGKNESMMIAFEHNFISSDSILVKSYKNITKYEQMANQHPQINALPFSDATIQAIHLDGYA